MKIKIFTNAIIQDMEKKVDEFIKDNEIIDVKYSTTMNEDFVFHSILIFYK